MEGSEKALPRRLRKQRGFKENGGALFGMDDREGRQEQEAVTAVDKSRLLEPEHG